MPEEINPLDSIQKIKRLQSLTKALETLEIVIANSIQATASKTALDITQTINNLRLSGMSDSAIRIRLLTDLNNGGVIFGTYRNAIKNTTGSAIHMASSEATRSVFEDNNVKQYSWITGGGNTCPDCLPRHGEIRTFEQWQSVGIPRSGFSVCGHNCGCTLVPSTYQGEDLEKALYRTERVKVLRKKYAESR
tara:strand:+ start:2553 stop:3128 length:576 start_codon:yes stop_codon:yes gene_type:complete